MEKEKGLMSVEEAADYLGVKRSTLYRWKYERKIPCIKVGHLLKFKKDQLDTWLEEREIEERREV